VVGKHLGNARTRWEEAARRLDRFGDKLTEVSDHAGEVEDVAADDELEDAPGIAPGIAPDAVAATPLSVALPPAGENPGEPLRGTG
ncbi:MAG TPA: hypothetical protein VGA45_11400, partial [Actinomycetota bacterium]